MAEARVRFGGLPQDWLDLSTGINPAPFPCTPSPHVDWGALPDPRALRLLEQRAADFFGVDADLCCAVPGSEIGLRLVARLLGLPGRSMLLSYSSHTDAFAHLGNSAPSGATTFVIANPNNPDGIVTPRAELLCRLARQEAGGGWLVVDEAFADCREDWSIARHVHQDRKLIVLRSFGKFFGLAGVRLGFVIAPGVLLKPLRHLLGEWPVCGGALTFGVNAYADTEWIALTRDALSRRAARLDDVLQEYGLFPKGECPLFRLVDTGRVMSLFTALAQRRILTRPFVSHPRLLRFGVPADSAALDRLGRALAECSGNG